MGYSNNSRFNFDGEQGYSVLVRIILFVGAVAGGYVAYRFSVAGFNAQVSGMVWAANCIVIMNTAIQVYVNHYQQRHSINLALVFGGIVSYGYGIYTNIIGILAVGGNTFRGVLNSGEYERLIIPTTIGIPLELVPEALLVLALFPESRTVASDAIAGLVNLVRSVFGMDGYARPRVSSMRDRSSSQPAYRPVQPAQPARRSESPLNPRRQQQPATPEPTYHPVGMRFDDDDQVE